MTKQHEIQCCADADGNNCCKGFLTMLGYTAYMFVGFVLCNYTSVAVALADAEFNRHAGMYDEVLGGTTSSTVVFWAGMQVLAFMGVSWWLWRWGLIRPRAIAGVAGSVLFWNGLVNGGFVRYLTTDAGAVFRCNGGHRVVAEGADNATELAYGMSMGGSSEVSECVQGLDDGLLHAADLLMIGAMGLGLCLMAMSAGYSQALRKAHSDCGWTALCVVGDVVWYLFFPPAVALFIVLNCQDHCMPDKKRVELRPLQHPRAVDSSTTNV